MNRILLSICFLAGLAPTAIAADLQVQLSFTPTQTLPGVPVAMRLGVKNLTAAPLALSSQVWATMTASGGSTSSDSLGLPPQVWAGEPGTPASYTVEAGATLELLAPIDEFFASNPLFFSEDLPLWKTGEYDVVIAVSTMAGARTSSNTAHLSVVLPGSEDMAVWSALPKPFSGPLAYDHFATIAQHPSSEYYRFTAPFALNWAKRDLDEYATSLMLAVQGLPGAFIDGARLSIALRYYDSAGDASARNDHAAAGVISAKGRLYAQQLIDSPASSYGSSFGTAVKARLLTAEGWEAYYNRGRGPGPILDVRPTIDCRTDNGDGTYTWHFGYESAMSGDVTIDVGSKANRFAPPSYDRGQPSVFHPGEHHDIVVITGGPANLTWTIAGSVPAPTIAAPGDCAIEGGLAKKKTAKQ